MLCIYINHILNIFIYTSHNRIVCDHPKNWRWDLGNFYFCKFSIKRNEFMLSL